MTATDDILAALPLDQLAAQVGASPAEVQAAVETAVPALLGGMHANAQDAGGAASLEQAVGQHDGALLDELGAGAGLDRVDTADGARIAGHVFGDQHDDVVDRLGALSARQGAGGSDLVRRLIPILAPIVMSYLAKQLGARAGAGGAGGNVIGDVLGQVLAGAAQGAGSGRSSGGMGDLLGEVLGGLLGRGRRA